jgi:hypothetical protein
MMRNDPTLTDVKFSNYDPLDVSALVASLEQNTTVTTLRLEGGFVYFCLVGNVTKT